MKRRLLNLVALLSLLACVAAAALWVRSHYRRDNLWFCGADGRELWWLESVDGVVALRTAGGWPARAGPRFTMAPQSADLGVLVLAGDRPAVMIRGGAGAAVTEWQSRRTGARVRRGQALALRRPPGGTGMAPFGPPMAYFEVAAPHWMPATVAAVPAGAWLAARLPSLLRRRRLRHGLCPTCGYDLRATPDKCPECGRSAVEAGA